MEVLHQLIVQLHENRIGFHRKCVFNPRLVLKAVRELKRCLVGVLRVSLSQTSPFNKPSHGAARKRIFDLRAWARSASAEMHSGFTSLRGTCNMNCGIRVKMRAVPERVTQDLARLGSSGARGLEKFGGPFLVGKDFSNLDAFFCPVAYRVQTYGLKVDATSAAYLQRLLALPAMQEWLQGRVGGDGADRTI